MLCIMARPRTLPDSDIHAVILRLLAGHGEKAVTFSAVARATGLAAPTLVQRFGGLDGMLRAALGAFLDGLVARLDLAAAEAPLSAKGAAVLLKSLTGAEVEMPAGAILPALLREPELRARAALWREGVEIALALRLGGGDRGRERAAILFAAWQGQRMWMGVGDRGFRLRDAVRAIT